MGDTESEMDIEEFDEDENAPEIELLDRKEFLEKFDADSNPIDDIKWVFQALGAKDLIPSDAPSTGAWFLLQSLKKDDLLLKSFYTTVCTRLVPTKAQMDREDARSNDKRERLELIERLLLEPFDDAPVLSAIEEQAVRIQNRPRELEVSQKAS